MFSNARKSAVFAFSSCRNNEPCVAMTSSKHETQQANPGNEMRSSHTHAQLFSHFFFFNFISLQTTRLFVKYLAFFPLRSLLHATRLSFYTSILQSDFPISLPFFLDLFISFFFSSYPSPFLWSLVHHPPRPP